MDAWLPQSGIPAHSYITPHFAQNVKYWLQMWVNFFL